ncbi:MAG: alpha/beta hydrolase [Gammaproteobacteria bacterium]|nr:alpha/beta hydrolase [Gammaproteobacteria bacterium]
MKKITLGMKITGINEARAVRMGREGVSDIFEQNLNEQEGPFVFELSYPGEPLLIAFGGFKGRLGIPPFEFFKLTRGADVNKIYIRDLEQTWYHNALPDTDNSIDEIASIIKQKVADICASHVVVVGNSMGGYAAILFGIIVNADIIHAFAPQTFIGRFNRIWYRDSRCSRQVSNTYKYSDKRYMDLKRLLRLQETQCEIHIYYSLDDRLDRAHAERLRDEENVKLHSFTEGGHSVIKTLKHSGKLHKIIYDSLYKF